MMYVYSIRFADGRSGTCPSRERIYDPLRYFVMKFGEGYITEVYERIGEGKSVNSTLHQDRGSPMTAHGYLDFMNELDVTCSHSRPRVSNDNPFSESQFKTQKYQPDYPGRFTDISHAKHWCETYFDWYNFEHHHSGLAGFTPEQVFTGCYREVAVQKQRVLDERYERNPERFVRGHPIVPMPPETAAINPVVDTSDGTAIDDRVNFPTLSAAGYVK